jgi:hypothetical protein
VPGPLEDQSSRPGTKRATSRASQTAAERAGTALERALGEDGREHLEAPAHARHIELKPRAIEELATATHEHAGRPGEHPP